MDPAERTTFEYPVLSGSLQPALVFTSRWEEEYYEHFISSMLFEISFVLFTISSVFFSIPSVVFTISPMLPTIAALAFAESGWTTVQRKVGKGWAACVPSLCSTVALKV